MDDKEYIRNLVFAITVAILAVFAVDWLLPEDKKVTQATPEQIMQSEVEKITETAVTASAVAKGGDSAADKIVSISQALAENARVSIKNSFISGSLRLKGARIDDISLLKYRETLQPDSPNIVLFSPVGTAHPKYAEFGWVSAENISLPDSSSVWNVKEDTLTENSPVTLTWDNGQGLQFIRTISVDNKYMLTVKETVKNTTEQPVTLSPYGVIRQIGQPVEDGVKSYVSYTGPIAVMDNTLKDIGYEDLMENGKESFTTSEGGWIGITEKYWLSALIFNQNAKGVKGSFVYNNMNGKDGFQTDYMLQPITVAAGGETQVVSHLFVGAKDINTLDAYGDEYHIAYFDKAIDFGWYYFLTKPFLYILNFLYSFLGNMGLAILVFAFLLRLLVFPIANKSYVSMQKMKVLQPKIKDLQERYKNDRQRLSMEMMELYKREKVNPASGCLPAMIQIPIFFSLYKVLYISIEMRQAPFYGWIHDLSAPDPTSVLTLCGLINWPVPEILNIGVWPLIMGITMFIQFKMNPTPADKTQTRVFMLMPIIFTFMLAHFASGLVIYWAWSNILAIIQQRAIIHGINKKLKAHTKLKDIE
jgi:YidC/Oxa1 family membrane protein insertase